MKAEIDQAALSIKNDFKSSLLMDYPDVCSIRFLLIFIPWDNMVKLSQVDQIKFSWAVFIRSMALKVKWTHNDSSFWTYLLQFTKIWSHKTQELNQTEHILSRVIDGWVASFHFISIACDSIDLNNQTT